MVVVEHLVSPAALPRPPAFSPAIEQLSILSYNVLLPNSMDGWWTYKMYNPPLPEDAQYQSSWEYRRDLLKERFQLVDADVVCLQEVAPNSFEEDFAFMQDLGYDGVEMFKKGRFRPATFWKTSICELAVPAVHKDRCLITAFRMKKQQQEQDDDDDDDNTAEAADAAKKQTKNVTTTAISNKHWFVCNCHLQAGKQAPRRVRQINEAMRGILTLARKLKGKLVPFFGQVFIFPSSVLFSFKYTFPHLHLYPLIVVLYFLYFCFNLQNLNQKNYPVLLYVVILMVGKNAVP